MSFHCDVRVCCRHAGFYVLKNTGSAKLQALYFGENVKKKTAGEGGFLLFLERLGFIVKRF